MMTPDAYAEPDMLERLVSPLMKGEASIAYARQLPHKGADIFEAFPREFNYSTTSYIRSLNDAKTKGAQTFFCSNSCAAYRKDALDSIGGFRSVLLGEDTCATASLLREGHKIAYVAEAHVRHSHRYTLKQEFQRYFDTGLSRQSYRDLLTGSDESRGREFLRAFTSRVAKECPTQLPYAMLHTLTKWVGYRIGKAATRAPVPLKRALSSQKFYWDSNEFLRHQKEKVS
jgi:rhamnosyltransferase